MYIQKKSDVTNRGSIYKTIENQIESEILVYKNIYEKVFPKKRKFGVKSLIFEQSHSCWEFLTY